LLRRLTEEALQPASWTAVLSSLYAGVALFGPSERAVRRLERLIRACRGSPDSQKDDE
jgi:hypothetical protein